MAAPKGNQFWKLRSKHGRDKLFASPELLWEAACEYFEWCDKNPWLKHDVVKGGDQAGKALQIPTARPYTITGLCIYLGANKTFWEDFRKAGHEDFSSIITHIEETIYTHKFEGAAVGAFNASIIARDLGLSDKKEHSGQIAVQQITGMVVK